MQKTIIYILTLFITLSLTLAAGAQRKNNENNTKNIPDIIKVYKQSIPALRFIGKKYSNSDRAYGSFAAKWGEWHQNGWFTFLEKLIEKPLNETHEDGDAYVGLMRIKGNEPFEYWIGMFFPENTSVPEGYGFVDFPKGNLGTCWIYGTDRNVFFKEGECPVKLKEAGMEIVPDKNGVLWFFERYGCPRYTTPDGKGNIILDFCYFVK